MPGIVTSITITPLKVGFYQGVCAELCGEGHTVMQAEVRIQELTAFNTWLGSQ